MLTKIRIEEVYMFICNVSVHSVLCMPYKRITSIGQ